MTNDVSGYYARLGVKPDASAGEIKSAYRRRAKQCHPDTGNAGSSPAEFQRLNEAYDVLRDSSRRANYDASGYAAPKQKGPEQTAFRNQIEPIVCASCRKVAAQPRYIVFRQVISIILTTMRTPIQGIYCSQCARKAALKATAVSSLLGWWGLPWGPIYTIVEGVRNGFGGDRALAHEEQLLWHNAVAFLSSGNFRIAYALACRLDGASDGEIGRNAALMRSYIESLGSDHIAGRVKDVWRPQFGYVIAHLLMLAAVPAAATAFIYNSSGGQSSFSYDPLTPAYDPVTPAPLNYGPESVSDNQPDSAPDTEPAPVCDDPPANGAILAGGAEVGSEEGHVLEIQNGSGGGAIVKMRHIANNDLLASFYVANQATASLTGIPDGTYVIQYAFGDALAPDCKSFNAIGAAGEFPDRDTLTTTYEGGYVRRVRIGYTLYSVPLGNVQPLSLDPSAFNAD